MSRTRALLLASLAATACADEQPATEVTVVIGTGQDAFEPLADGDEVPVIQGPQGGFHILGAFYATGIEPGDPNDLSHPDNPTGEFRVFEGERRVDISDASRFTQGLEPIGDGFGTVGRLVVLDIADDAELDGASVRFEVSVEDVDGHAASDEVALTLYPFPGNP